MSIPLSERYAVCVSYIEKDVASYFYEKSLLQELIDYFIEHTQPDRHEVVDYCWLMDSLCDTYNHEPEGINEILNKHIAIIRDSKIDSILSDKSVESITGVEFKSIWGHFLQKLAIHT